MRITLLYILVFTIALGAIPALAQEETFSVQGPETIEEAQEFGIQFLQALPQAMKDVWDKEALPFFQKFWDWTINVWNTQIFHRVESQWQKMLSFFTQEIEQRKPDIEERLAEEKQKLQQEIEQKLPEGGKTLWQLIKGLLPGLE